jgi:hypothetical protein
LASGDGGLRLGAALEQAARDQKAIGALAFDHGAFFASACGCRQ